MDNEVIIRVRNLVKSFVGRVVLEGINLDVRKGEITAIMGGSGCGKSTLLRHLIGVLRPDSGEIWVKGKDITKFDENEMEAYRKHFGMLFQGGALFNSLTVRDNIALPLREHTELDERIIGMIVKMKLELVGLRDFEYLKPAQLSGGMQKRVALARALALDPEIVFYDEPTIGLDRGNADAIEALIAKMCHENKSTSVVASHDLVWAGEIAHRVAIVFDGKVQRTGMLDELRRDPDKRISGYLRAVRSSRERNIQ